MAGIEKICEYSGEYIGPAMYSYKHNLIQIAPQYRKLFRGVEHTFIVYDNPELHWVWNWGASQVYDENDMKYWGFTDEYEYIRFHKKRFGNPRLIPYWHYCLHVPSIPGRVDGYYHEYTFDLTATKRKIKRMLRKTLNIEKRENEE